MSTRRSTKVTKLSSGLPPSPADEPESWMSSHPADEARSSMSSEYKSTPDSSKEHHPRNFKDSLLLASGIDVNSDVQQKEERLTAEDEAIRSQFTAQEIRDLEMVFNTFDQENTGCIDVVNVRRALRVLGFKISMKTVTRMVEDLDDERNGMIVTFSDFLEIVSLRQGDSRDPYEELIQGFKMMDTGNRGKLSYTDLKRAAHQAGVKFTDKDVWEMIEEADLNGDRMINQDEFIQIMLQTNLF
ncbi:centrin-1-like [Amphiura filiformis]|uniref:centrin-1-like n=1 Tax=Amphiura filiformis TaxID=82378 RepID=UPI003B21C8DB